MTKAERDQLREVWRARVAEFRASGETVRAWAAAHNVSTTQVYYWMARFPAEAPKAQGRFLSVRVEDPDKEAQPLDIRVGDVVLEVRRGCDLALLKEVLRAVLAL